MCTAIEEELGEKSTRAAVDVCTALEVPPPTTRRTDGTVQYSNMHRSVRCAVLTVT